MFNNPLDMAPVLTRHPPNNWLDTPLTTNTALCICTEGLSAAKVTWTHHHCWRSTEQLLHHSEGLGVNQRVNTWPLCKQSALRCSLRWGSPRRRESPFTYVHAFPASAHYPKQQHWVCRCLSRIIRDIWVACTDVPTTAPHGHCWGVM